MRNVANIAKHDSKQQLVLCEVFVPDVVDAQGEFASPDTLEKAAHKFAAGGNHNNVSIMHDGKRIDASVVETYIAKPKDPLFKSGTWVAVLKVRDPDVWQAIEDGALKGVSFEGRGNRRTADLNGKKATEMIDLDIHTISIVDRPANRRPFVMTKSDNSLAAITEQFESLTTKIGKLAEGLETRLADNQAKIDQLSARVHGRVRKSVTPHQDPDVSRLLRKRQRLQDRFESIVERPDMFDDDAEREICKALQRVEDDLYAYGHEDRRAGLDSNSAFYQRGGTSNFLVASVSSLDSVLGVQNRVSKSEEDAVEVENCLVL